MDDKRKRFEFKLQQQKLKMLHIPQSHSHGPPPPMSSSSSADHLRSPRVPSTTINVDDLLKSYTEKAFNKQPMNKTGPSSSTSSQARTIIGCSSSGSSSTVAIGSLSSMMSRPMNPTGTYSSPLVPVAVSDPHPHSFSTTSSNGDRPASGGFSAFTLPNPFQPSSHSLMSTTNWPIDHDQSHGGGGGGDGPLHKPSTITTPQVATKSLNHLLDSVANPSSSSSSSQIAKGVGIGLIGRPPPPPPLPEDQREAEDEDHMIDDDFDSLCRERSSVHSCSKNKNENSISIIASSSSPILPIIPAPPPGPGPEPEPEPQLLRTTNTIQAANVISPDEHNEHDEHDEHDHDDDESDWDQLFFCRSKPAVKSSPLDTNILVATPPPPPSQQQPPRPPPSADKYSAFKELEDTCHHQSVPASNNNSTLMDIIMDFSDTHTPDLIPQQTHQQQTHHNSDHETAGAEQIPDQTGGQNGRDKNDDKNDDEDEDWTMFTHERQNSEMCADNSTTSQTASPSTQSNLEISTEEELDEEDQERDRDQNEAGKQIPSSDTFTSNGKKTSSATTFFGGFREESTKAKPPKLAVPPPKEEAPIERDPTYRILKFTLTVLHKAFNVLLVDNGHGESTRAIRTRSGVDFALDLQRLHDVASRTLAWYRADRGPVRGPHAEITRLSRECDSLWNALSDFLSKTNSAQLASLVRRPGRNGNGGGGGGGIWNEATLIRLMNAPVTCGICNLGPIQIMSSSSSSSTAAAAIPLSFRAHQHGGSGQSANIGELPAPAEPLVKPSRDHHHHFHVSCANLWLNGIDRKLPGTNTAATAATNTKTTKTKK